MGGINCWDQRKLSRRAIRLSVFKFSAVPTHRLFDFVLSFGLFSFPFAFVHGIDLQGVIVGSMVSRRVPLSFGHMVVDERVPDTGIRGYRTESEVHLRSQRGCQRSHQHADQHAVSKDLLRCSRTFGSVVVRHFGVCQ